MLNDKEIVLIKNPRAKYPVNFPFHPSEKYPEYPFLGIGQDGNDIYQMVREFFRAGKFDITNYGKNSWNPLGDIIKPGNTVLIKPNLVRHYHPHQTTIEAIVTHGSVIRAVLDYVFIATKGQGKIIIGDAPLQNCDFEQLCRENGLFAIQEFYKNKNIGIELIDFRKERALTDANHVIFKKISLKGDPRGYQQFNLGSDSLLRELVGAEFRVTNYDPGLMKEHHAAGHHEYVIANTVLQTDVVISLPKLKTHRKAGLTCALKNMVGINGNKDWLPHHRKGSLNEHGDEYLYPNFLKRIYVYLAEIEGKTNNLFFKYLLKIIRGPFKMITFLIKHDNFWEGSWHGNDTVWRTILDLNRILLYGDRAGRLSDDTQRKCLTIVDAIIAGEGEGPLEPASKFCGIIFGGINPVAVDAVASKIMGFDWQKIPTIRNAFLQFKYPLVNFPHGEINLLSGDSNYQNNFIPAKGWKNHIELMKQNKDVSADN